MKNTLEFNPKLKSNSSNAQNGDNITPHDFNMMANLKLDKKEDSSRLAVARREFFIQDNFHISDSKFMERLIWKDLKNGEGTSEEEVIKSISNYLENEKEIIPEIEYMMEAAYKNYKEIREKFTSKGITQEESDLMKHYKSFLKYCVARDVIIKNRPVSINNEDIRKAA